MNEMDENEKNKLIQENPHLKKYLSDIKKKKLSEPFFYYKLSRDIKEKKNPNLIYPTKGSVFIHIYSKEGSDFINYGNLNPGTSEN